MLVRLVLTTAILAPVAGMQFSSLPTEDTVSWDGQQVSIDADGTATVTMKDGGKRNGQGDVKQTQSEEESGKDLEHVKKPRAKRLCHPSIVKQVCSEAFKGSDGKNVQWDQITSALSATHAAVANLRSTLKLKKVGPVGCTKLCKALITNLKSAGATVPERSGEACVCKEGNASCGVDVGERKIRGSVHTLKEKHNGGLTDDVRDDNEEVGVNDPDIIGTDIKIDEDCPDGFCISYTQEELVASLVRLFHIFPNFECGTKISLLQRQMLEEVSSEPSGWWTKIENAKVQAQAWTDFARGQLSANTGASERDRWFGGGGSKSSSVVKNRIQQSLNWISQKIARANYVYVPDNYMGQCAGSSKSGTLAFVWNYGSPYRAPGAFRAASDKKCGSNIGASQWLAQKCVLDASGNLIVFMCQKWANFPEDTRTSTIVHELIHHTGPGDDAGYDSEQISQRTSQANQLENAENYAELVTDIVDGDCVDRYGWSMDSQNPPWNCASFALYTDSCSQYGGSSESHLQGRDGTNANAACCVCGGGTRSGPTYSPGPVPRPTPWSTPRPTPRPMPRPTPRPSPTPTPSPQPNCAAQLVKLKKTRATAAKFKNAPWAVKNRTKAWKAFQSCKKR